MSDLPIHPVTGLQALGVTRRGPIWPVLGASSEDPSNGGAPATGTQGQQPSDGEQQLGDAGKKALDQERAARQAAETASKAMQKQIDDLTAKLTAATAEPDNRPELEKQLEAMQAQIDASAQALKAAEENAAKANLAQLRTDRGAAKGLPPALAKLLTGTTAEELDAEIDALLPHLKQGPLPNPQQGNPSQGKGGSINSGRERYAAAHK